MKKAMTVFGTILFASFILSSCGDSCKGHENDIKNGQLKRAKKLGMTVNDISVEYIDDCKYKVTSETFDPQANYGAGNTFTSSTIYEWKNNNYVFVSGN